MTELMEQALSRLKQLSDERQDSIAAIILDELLSPSRFDGMTHNQILQEARAEYQAGLTKPMTKDHVIAND